MNPTDRAILSPRIRPMAAEDFRPERLHALRELVIREDRKLRAGFPACIEVKDHTGWLALMLPNSGIEFVGKKDRDKILDILRGDAPLPAIPEPPKQ